MITLFIINFICNAIKYSHLNKDLLSWDTSCPNFRLLLGKLKALCIWHSSSLVNLSVDRNQWKTPFLFVLNHTSYSSYCFLSSNNPTFQLFVFAIHSSLHQISHCAHSSSCMSYPWCFPLLMMFNMLKTFYL